MVLEPDILVSLAEVSVAFTGFIGIVVVLGGGPDREWKPVEDARFWTLMLNTLTPIALALLPLRFGPESYTLIGLLVGGTWAILCIWQAVSAMKVPDANVSLAVFIITTSASVYGVFVASAMTWIELSVEQCYLAIILWNITMAVIFFVRLLRSSRAVA